MTIRYGGACLVLAFVSLLGAADGPIRLPVSPPVPQPLPPAPNPDPISALAADQLYIVDSDTPLIVLASPKGLVSVSEEAGPLKIRGRFVDGTGKVETKTYRGKHIFTIEALGSGRVELLIVPVGAAKEADVIRRVIDVSAGEGPIPPPKPKPDPKPDPKPVDPAPIPEAGLRVMIVYESQDLPKMPPAQSAIIYGAKVREYLNANCVVGPDGKTREYRFWDADVDASGESKLWQGAFKRSKTKIAEWEPIKDADGKVIGPSSALPWLLISNPGKGGFEGPLPADVDAFLSLVKTYEVAK